MNQKIEKWDDVHGNTTPDDRLVAFLESSNDSYAILQLKRIDETMVTARLRSKRRLLLSMTF